MGSNRRRRIGAGVVALATAGALAACGSSSSSSSTTSTTGAASGPGKGKPAVTMGDKNFTEEFVLAQLYAQALRAKGFTVNLKEGLGSTEL
ncbi:MAG TPA: glycine betaine ABC transporter substrate-binding protein, partial [Solirubrobacteraceae bacterium]|nr:glycine betaine ABC transporter substrate-binding protein [Solirubrobacteraceae bacterium]